MTADATDPTGPSDPSDVPVVEAGDARIPALGFGTARMEGERCRAAVADALDLGYRHLDTAQMYGNERAVGAALDDADVSRDDVFLVTKLDVGNRSRDAVHETTRASLERLGVDAVDLLLIHSPNRSVSLDETLGAMNALRDEGLVSHLGVSNFPASTLDHAVAASDAPIVADQVQYHPYHRQDELLERCAERGVCLTAYSPLAVGDIVDDPTLGEIGERYGKTAAQVALRWLVQQERVAAIPKAATREHAAENLAVFDFALDDGEMERIAELSGGVVDRIAELLGLRSGG